MTGVRYKESRVGMKKTKEIIRDLKNLQILWGTEDKVDQIMRKIRIYGPSYKLSVLKRFYTAKVYQLVIKTGKGMH